MEPSTPNSAASVPFDLPNAFRRSNAALILSYPSLHSACAKRLWMPMFYSCKIVASTTLVK
eukprot:2177558-Amphidinium_carterae.1